jgi:DnaJ-class molecular chaperone
MDNSNQFADIFKMAQQVASKIDVPKSANGEMDASQVDIGKLFQEVSRSVSQMVTPDMMSKFANMNAEPSCSTSIPQINYKKTKDLRCDLNLPLRYFYTGKTKNVSVKRNRLDDNGNMTEEKKIITVEIPPGMEPDSEIIFKGEGDEKPGYTTSDVIITVKEEEHDDYVRMNDDLYITKFVNLPECYEFDFTFTHINGKDYRVQRTDSNIFMASSGQICIANMGMPIKDSKKYGNLYIRFRMNTIENMPSETLKTLQALIPPLLTVQNEDAPLLDWSAVESDSDYNDSDDDNELSISECSD